jgi:hypothetical protein
MIKTNKCYPLEFNSGVSLQLDYWPLRDAIHWLERHTWGRMRFDYDAESSVQWRCRWAAWPMVAASGAGHTLEEAIRRCLHAARVRVQLEQDRCNRERGTVTDAELEELFKEPENEATNNGPEA